MKPLPERSRDQHRRDGGINATAQGADSLSGSRYLIGSLGDLLLDKVLWRPISGALRLVKDKVLDEGPSFRRVNNLWVKLKG